MRQFTRRWVTGCNSLTGVMPPLCSTLLVLINSHMLWKPFLGNQIKNILRTSCPAFFIAVLTLQPSNQLNAILPHTYTGRTSPGLLQTEVCLSNSEEVDQRGMVKVGGMGRPSSQKLIICGAPGGGMGLVTQLDHQTMKQQRSPQPSFPPVIFFF